MKIIDEKQRQKNKEIEEKRLYTRYSESVRVKGCCCTFKVSFISSFKRKRIIAVKACCGGV